MDQFQTAPPVDVVVVVVVRIHHVVRGQCATQRRAGRWQWARWRHAGGDRGESQHRRVSPGAANTAASVAATDAFLTSLDDFQRDVVKYDFSDNKSRQKWSNFPATTAARLGIALADLDDAQRAAFITMLGAALSEPGSTQDTKIGHADDYLNSLGGQGADGFGCAQRLLRRCLANRRRRNRSWSSSPATIWQAR